MGNHKFWQGEEIGMLNTNITWEDTKDPQACNTDDPINYWKSSRDPARTPFQWNDEVNAGIVFNPVNSLLKESLKKYEYFSFYQVSPLLTKPGCQ